MRSSPSALLAAVLLCAGASPLAAAPTEYDLAQATPEQMDAWKIFAALPNEIEAARYVAVPIKPGGPTRWSAIGDSQGHPSPQIVWRNDGRVQVIPFSDRKLYTATSVPDRDVIVGWTCPQTGNWELEARMENAGTDVDGGDGGTLVLSRLGVHDQADTAIIAREAIPIHRAPTNRVAIRRVIQLTQGDRLLLRTNGGIDNYGDCFLLNYQIRASTQIGERILNKGYEAVLAEAPSPSAAPGSPLRSGLFWLGCDGKWANSPHAQESFNLVRKFIPNTAAVMITSRPDQLQQPDFYRHDQIPTIIQTYGSGYEPWLHSQKAFEVNWDGVDLGMRGENALMGTAHAAALPHPATREAYERVVRAAIGSGYSGFGFCDMVWMWGGGRGKSGYNPATIAAFRRDLQGSDEGLVLARAGTEPVTFHFGDYVEFYLGGKPAAQIFRLTDWSQYSPPSKREVEAGIKQDFTADWLLFDLLVHYEWLKFNDRLSQTARAAGGFYQCMPNPEDMANGADLLFAFRLNSVRAVGEEFFNNPAFLDAAYVRFAYLSEARPPGLQSGIVLESGGGGNGWPYYASEIAYTTAYELTLATQADYCEGDFWPSTRARLAVAAQTPESLSRYRQLLAYGLGFHDAREDHAVRHPADFTSVTSRRIFRPWGGDWLPWTMTLRNPGSPEGMLAEAGFSFSGIGEEGLAALGPQSVLLYSPEIPTENGWITLLDKVKAGQIKSVIVPAASLREVVTKGLQRKPFAEVFPAWNAKESGAWSNGQAAAPLSGPRYEQKGVEPVVSVDGRAAVARTKVGDGWVYILLYDVTRPENAAYALSTYQGLLAKSGAFPHWSGDGAVTVRLYNGRNDLLIAGVQANELRSWKGTKGTAEGFRPAHVATEHSARVVLTPKEPYALLSMPSGRRTVQTTDSEGRLELQLHQSTHELFFVLPAAREAELDTIASRKSIFDQAMNLDGLGR